MIVRFNFVQIKCEGVLLPFLLLLMLNQFLSLFFKLIFIQKFKSPRSRICSFTKNIIDFLALFLILCTVNDIPVENNHHTDV